MRRAKWWTLACALSITAFWIVPMTYPVLVAAILWGLGGLCVAWATE